MLPKPRQMPNASASPDPRLAPAANSNGAAGPDAEPRSVTPMLANPRDIVASLRCFPEISLEETNKTARMLNRIDNKYVVSRSELVTVLDELKDDFKLLKIEGCDIFSYKSCYFDDNGRCFREHQQGKRQRFKVRTRLYVESDKAYFEVKLKGKRGQTDKSRKKCDQFHDFAVSDEQQLMLRNLYEKNYGKAFLHRMTPALHVTYKRFTLVSASGGERVTVDFHLGFEAPSGKTAQVGDDFIIVETKSADGRGKSDRILKHNRIRQAKSCSKYCIGMVLAGEVRTYNKFRAIVKTIRSRMRSPDHGERQRHSGPIHGGDQPHLHAGPSRCAK